MKWFVDIKDRRVNFFVFFKPVYMGAYEKNEGGGWRLLGGGVRLVGIIQYVSVRNWPKPGKLVLWTDLKILNTSLSDFFFFFAATRQPQC